MPAFIIEMEILFLCFFSHLIYLFYYLFMFWAIKHTFCMELPQRRHGGEHLLIEIFYAGSSKWLNALHFLQAEKEYEPL